ncbi:hypothetical protein Adu01nite_87760 [Paractinoplanes durhamensis]|uniref:Uncharacterized protein n=1 Tax=Paractinoplanes durhamensis TaxID=113563 RepID=A0ABQ3ZC78_9ACTN|nr:hypothetical protein [Actinoplanes durhamensis]GIE07426.1 hypothetical protein Adu01nite_87760 [Actinoplanes durhamensis]
MDDDLRAAVDGLTRLDSVTGIWELVDARVRAGDAGSVAEFGNALLATLLGLGLESVLAAADTD